MGLYPATVRLVPGDGTERPRPFDLRVATRIGAVELRLRQLSGGEALHCALAMCVFNNIARESRDRSIQLRELSVTADGDFDSDELSTGISFSISITGAATVAGTSRSPRRPSGHPRRSEHPRAAVRRRCVDP